MANAASVSGSEAIPEGLILFDGVCVLCSRWVAFILERDTQAIFRFASMQSPRGRKISASLNVDPDHPETFVVIWHGLPLTKSAGALAILGALPGWRWSRGLRVVPRGLRDWLYDRVARNRYRIFGRRQSCLLPSPEVADRFIDAVIPAQPDRA
jgi:predicted DCC family thiol-disulfide oxidoreductase YuxK